MERQALVVGINRYPTLIDKPTDKPRHLKAPAADAEAIAQILATYGGFHVQRLPVDNQDGDWRVAPEKLVKLTELENAITQLFHPPKGIIRDTALLFFAGHGLRKNQGGVTESFLATSDTSPVIGQWGLPLDWLRKLLQSSPVRRQIVWLDCCYSGELLYFDEADPGSFAEKDRCLIAASREFEVAYEEFSGNHGVLSGALLNALKPENHSEGWVTNYSLVDSVKQQLKTARQRPIFHNTGGEIILTGQKEKIERAVLMAGVCPYKGLASFEFNEEDPKYFYGRTALTDKLLDNLRKSNFLAVVGASGSGKSSVVKAGLLHQLKLGQRLGGSDQWVIKIFRPGEHPLKSLAIVLGNPNEDSAVLAEALNNRGASGLIELVTATLQRGEISDEGNLPISSRLVLVVDQFEEVFTLCQDERKRQRFFECLLGALDEPQLTVVITMRADFFGKCAEQEYAGLAQKIQAHLVTVTPMSKQELKEAITLPAYKVGLEVQRELVEQMLADVDGPGSLPLLQYTLTELWRDRQVNRLTLAEYTRLGGVKGTLEKRADKVYEQLEKSEKLVAEQIFLKLTQLGEGTEDTRRQVLKTDLLNDSQSAEVVERVLRKLIEARLVVASELQARGESEKTVTVVDVAHEALIRHWPKLRTWVSENRDAIRRARKIEAALEEWESNKQSKGFLLTGARLEDAENDLQEYKNRGLLSSSAIEFVLKSIQQRKRDKWLRFGAVASFIAVVTIGGVVSTFFALQSQKLALEATLGENAARVNNLLPIEPVEGLVLAIKATGESKDKLRLVRDEVQSSLREAITVVQERNLLKGHTSSVMSVAITPDGQTIVSGSDDGTVRLWNRLGKPLGQPLKGHTNSVRSVAITPDGQTIVSGSDDGTVRLWNRLGKPLGQPLKGHTNWVRSVAITPDGQTIVSGSDDGTVRLWNRGGKPLGQPLKGHTNSVSSVAITPDGQTIVSGSDDGTVRLWNRLGKSLGQPLKGHTSTVNSVAITPDGQTIVSGSYDKTVRLWNRLGKSLGQPLKGHTSTVNSVAITPDGQTIVSGSDDGTVRLWNRGGKSLGQPLKGHTRSVSSVAITPDGQTIVSGSLDNTVRLWNRLGKPLGQPLKGHTRSVSSVAITPDGQTIVSGSWDGTVRLWQVGNWQAWLKEACNNLRYHPVLVIPETDEAKAAAETCLKYGQWNNTKKAEFLLLQGEALARNGDIKAAEDKFNQAENLDGKLAIPSKAELGKLAAPALVTKGEELVKDGKFKEAVAAYKEAEKLDPNLKITADSWNSLCWYGSLHGQAADVMFACEKAVALEPKNGDILDSRGVARALTGDTKGAIEDFEAFIKSTDDKEAKAQRQGWVKDLRAGKNPFTKEEIQRLL